MNWLCEFETADGLEARKIIDFIEPRPQHRLRLPLRRKISMLPPKEEEPFKPEPLLFREYELRKWDIKARTCYYVEINFK